MIHDIVEKLHLEKIGAVGSMVAVLCCLGFAPLISMLSAIGAVFILNDAILAPLLLVALSVGALGLALSYWRHRKPYALILHVAAGSLLYGFTFVRYDKRLIWLGIVLLFAASVYNVFLRRACTARGHGVER